MSESKFSWKDRKWAVKRVGIKVKDKDMTFEESVIETLTHKTLAPCWFGHDISRKQLELFIKDAWEEYQKSIWKGDQPVPAIIDSVLEKLRATRQQIA